MKMNHKKLIFLLGCLILWVGTAVFTQAQSSDVFVIELDGDAIVSRVIVDHLDRSIKTAEEQNAEAVVLLLNTPGGSVELTLDIVEIFRNSNVPVIVYVSPAGGQAASAGSIITAAGHVAAMAPETIVGAASPVDFSGGDIQETLYNKLVEDLKATMRSLTERRGEEVVAIAEDMIEDATAITVDEALEIGFIDFKANDLDDLLRQADGFEVLVNETPVVLQTANARQIATEFTFIEQFLFFITIPEVLSLLLTIGSISIILEVRSPGFGIAGALGIICMAFALYGLNQLPVNWFGMVLVGAAFVFLTIEAFTPTSGPLAAIGGVALLAGILVLFNSQESPEFLRISIAGAATIALVTTSLFGYITAKIVQATRMQPSTGVEGMVGQTAVSRSAFADKNGLYAGTVLLHGEIWRAIADNPIEKGENVVVKTIDGFTAKVQKVDQLGE